MKERGVAWIMGKKKCIAMLLAGGKGTRLCSLTKNLAKPAVPFGGKYRIIDFSLSNCANSGIDTVGVLTQYQPLVLNSYIGIGSAWDLDRRNGGVTLLPPFAGESDVKWYAGTASAIYQNLNFIEQNHPEYVLILSGDHIYKMDYSLLLEYHIEKKADCTISVIEVPWHEASRFGIMNTNEKMEIIEFEEKPQVPKNNLASMGIYIFTWKVLKEILKRDNENPRSSHDFGKDIIPQFITYKKRLMAFRFRGYWKDVGTINSLWEANMDLLKKDSGLDLFDDSWRIYSVNQNHPPQYLAPTSSIHNSLVNEGCNIYGKIDHSVIFQGVYIGEQSYIKECVVMPDVYIGENVIIEKAIIPSGMHIPDGTIIKNVDDDVLLVNEIHLSSYVSTIV